MKRFILIAFIACTSTPITFAQLSSEQQNTISLQYGISSTIIATDQIGAPSLDGYAHNIGLHYNRSLSPELAFETGLRYAKNYLSSEGIDGSGTQFNRDYTSSYIHIPMLLQYNFLTVLYSQFGPTASFRVQHDNEINQSGIGVWGSVGAQFVKNKYNFSFGPYFHSQSLIAFKERAYKSQLNAGINVALGIKF